MLRRGKRIRVARRDGSTDADLSAKEQVPPKIVIRLRIGKEVQERRKNKEKSSRANKAVAPAVTGSVRESQRASRACTISKPLLAKRFCGSNSSDFRKDFPAATKSDRKA